MTATHPSFTPRQERWLLLTLAAINFTHIVDFMLMMPLGPQFTALFHISDAEFGLLVSAYTLAAGVSGLAATTYIDRFERKTLLLRLYAAFALATLACGLAPSYATLMAARILAGLFGGVLGALVQTIVGDAIPFERRGRAMSVVMASFSLAAVVGVPASLWLANAASWHAPFFAIAGLSAAVCLAGALSLPRLDGHLGAALGKSATSALRAVLREPNHWRAFGLSMLVMSAGFSIIPYVTLYSTQNLGVQPGQVPLIYLAGGMATLFTVRLWGTMTDRWGKVPTFRLIAAGSMLPMLALTHLPAVPLWGLILVSSLFFVFVSGRMVPSMAILTSATQPHMRGTFMSLNAAMQSLAMGAAAFVGGLLIHRDPAGRLVGYGWAGWLSVALTLIALVWVSRVRMNAPAAVA